MNRISAFLTLALVVGCSDDNEPTGSETDATSMGDMAMGDASMNDMAIGDTADDAITATSGTTADGTFSVSYEIDGAPSVGATFAMTVSVFESDGSTAVTDASITLEESMPGMGHGMDTEPEIAANGDGTFAVANLAYSMAGSWRYDFTVRSGERSDTISFATECCE